MNKIDSEAALFTFQDVKQLYIASRSKIFKRALVSGAAVFLGLGLCAQKYKVEASFKESAEQSPRSADGILKEILGGIQTTQQPQAVSFMKSFQILKPLVEKMGLQVTQIKSDWLLGKLIRRYINTFRAEAGAPLLASDDFVFKDVCYQGEEELSFLIRFESPQHFTVLSDKKEPLGAGMVGEVMTLENESARFTLKKTPKALKVGKCYPFVIKPWMIVAKTLGKHLQIVVDQANKSIYKISLLSQTRQQGIEIVNELMAQYQSYLKREYDDLAKHQISYLENKQAEVCEKLDRVLVEHAEYFRNNLKENGFIGLDGEGKGFSDFYQEMYSKALAVDTSLDRLNLIQGKDSPIFCLIEGDSLPSEFSQVSQNLRNFQQQKDLLEASLAFSNREKSSFFKDSLKARTQELKEVRDQRFALEKILHHISSGQEIASLHLPEEASFWAGAIHASREKQDVSHYLDHHARLLSVREKMLQESSLYEKNRSLELEGIDLPTARSLLVQYNNQLDETESKLRHYLQYKQELELPDFEIACLSSILKDPISQKLISEASTLRLQLKNEKHHSSKETIRWEEEISLNKKILANHLHQLYKVESLNASLLKEKMVDLQKISLDCINRQISVLTEQAENSIKNYRENLLEEKKLLENKMKDLKAAASSLPDKWRLEKWLQIKAEVVGKIMETVTEVAESKTITRHLHQVASKPLDFATASLMPEKPYILAKSIFGAFLGALLFFIVSFFKKLKKGFPLSLEKLQFLNFPTLGCISSFCDGPLVETKLGPDLEILRKIASFSKEARVVGLIAGNGPDYSYALAENLSLLSRKTLILRCDFQSKFQAGDVPGVLQIWKDGLKEVPIRSGKGFSYLTAGGFSPFGTEIIESVQFRDLLDRLKGSYDHIFLLLKGSIVSTESAAALKHCDKAVVTISKETTEELTLFTNWAYHGDSSRLTFITNI